jgi:hypothetical protein
MWTPTLGPISELHYISKRFAKYLDFKQKYVEERTGWVANWKARTARKAKTATSVGSSPTFGCLKIIINQSQSKEEPSWSCLNNDSCFWRHSKESTTNG